MSISTESISYGFVTNETILTIFGSEMTYNVLKLYAKNSCESTHLRVKTFTDTDNDAQIITVLFNDEEVFEQEYSINHSCDMFYHLEKLEQQCDHCNDCFHQGLMCEHGTCPDCRHLCEVCKEEESDDEEETEYDDKGVLCKYSVENGWTPIEDHCFKCGFKPDECFCDSCDCCMKGWDAENKYGRCICMHSHCQDLLRNCKYNCC